MKTIIIFHSQSGKTKQVAEKIKNSLSGDLVEVSPKQAYSSLMVYPKGCYRAMKGEVDDINPEKIDVVEYDMVVIASPVWAGKPTPVINGAIKALNGCSGKKAWLFLTCGAENSGKEAVPIFKARLEDMGLVVSGETVLDKTHVHDQVVIEDLISKIRTVGDMA